LPGVDDARTFLGALFGDVPDEQRFLVWSLPDKVSRWYRPSDAGRAAEEACALARHDVYVGAGLSARERGSRQRVVHSEVSGIVALWADVDVEDEAHRKSGLPPTLNDAGRFVREAGASPSIVVRSGHGLQAWWLLDEPWIFEGREDRGAAAALVTRWNLTLRVRAAEHGWTLDSTHDLARVMRLPGTTNRKTEPVPVVIEELEPRLRYAPDDLAPFLVDDAALTMLAGRRTYHVGELRLDPDASPPHDKHDALLSNDRRFAATWARSRRDMPDDSPSGYDLSLASQVAAVGWTDQEIADLLVASRRKHGDDLKLRPDYYARTISRARDDRAREHSSEEIAVAAEHVEHAEVVGDANGVERARKELVGHVATVLGVEVVRLVRFTQDPPRYRLETTGGAITLGEAGAILSQSKMREKIAGATGIVVARFKAPKWDAIAQAMFKACEDEDTGIESTDEGTAFSWVTEYLQDRPVLASLDEAAETQQPFERAGQVYVFGPSLRKWLHFSRGERVSGARMGEVLRSYGCEPETVNVTVRSKRSTRSVWRVGASEDIALHRRPDRPASSGSPPGNGTA